MLLGGNDLEPQVAVDAISQNKLRQILIRRKILPWLATILWMVVIWLFSNQPHSGAITQHFFGDLNVLARKLGHVTEYTILFLLLCASLKATDEDLKLGKLALLAFVVAAFYAIGDECHQFYVPGRSATWFDVSVDCLGISLGLPILFSRFGRRILSFVTCS